MAKTHENKGEQESSPGDVAIPPYIQIPLALAFSAVALLAALLMVRYALWDGAKPSELGLGTVLSVCLVSLGVVLIPWSTLGLSLKRIGPIEFVRVMKEQKREQIQNDEALLKRITGLEQQLQAVGLKIGMTGLSPPAPTPSTDSVAQEIKRFLSQHGRWMFNAPRIKALASSLPDFDVLRTASVSDIDQVLQRLFAANEIRARFSKKSGRTLYGTM